MADTHEKIIIEKRGGGLTAVVVLLLIALLAVGGYFLVTSQTQKNDAIAGAAQSVEHTADKIGGAVDDANGK